MSIRDRTESYGQGATVALTIRAAPSTVAFPTLRRPPTPSPESSGSPPLTKRLAGSFAHTRRTLGLVWRSSPGGLMLAVVLTVVSAILPVAAAWVGKFIVDGVMAAYREPPGPAHDAALAVVTRWIAVELAVMVGIAVVDRGLGLVRQLTGARLGLDINLMILRKAQSLDLRHFEDPQFYDKLQRARREAGSRPMSLVQQTFTLVRNGLTLGGYSALLIGFSPWAVAGLALAGLPAFLAEARFSESGFRMRHRWSASARRLNYLEYVLSSDEHVKEVKLFALGPLLLERYQRLAQMFFDNERGLAVRRTLWSFATGLLATGAFYGCYVAIALATAAGRRSLGQMTLYLVAFRQGQQAFQGMLGAVSGMYEDNLYMSNLFEFLAIPTDRPEGSATVVRIEQGLRFEGVGFRYPDTQGWALRNVSLFIPRGESLALVGENGAGKTTFIKLLTRLYEPTEGRVLLDGRDLRSWDEVELRRRVGVIFQDFNQYQFVLRENVGIGSIDHLTDEARIGRAVEHGGARELVASLAAGLETQLGHWFQDGVELSGGQWQKIALARAFMREEADILVLDEPTAALDAETERAVFDRFRALTRGRTAILISHRFPTVRMADRILVLQKGQIIESGTHAELLEAGGRYAKLFSLQADGYR